jgi:hypothetical protein
MSGHYSDSKDAAETLTELVQEKDAVKVRVRSPTANDYKYDRSIPHDLAREYLGDQFGFKKTSDGKFKWTGGKAATVYKSLFFCESCSAFWWMNYRAVMQKGGPENCPSCECSFSDEDGYATVLDWAPNL